MEKSKVIFENQHYVACAMKDGSLIVQHKRKRKGYRLIGEQAPIWIAAIVNADDKQEASALCRAMCSQ